MAQFFLSWQLWEQMTFALACAMVIVVFAALVRNAWDWWNLRKHVRLLKGQQAEQAKLLAVHPSIRKRQLKGQVPFGVRAIQSGIEVEGVWISRPNSTFNSPSNTVPASPAPLDPEVLIGGKWALPKPMKDDDPLNPVIGATRQLELQTAGGRTIPPRAARDPFRDSLAASERDARSEKIEMRSQYNHKNRAPSSTYHSLPDEEAGFLPPGSSPSKLQASTRASQTYPTEHTSQPSANFTLPNHQPQAYTPTTRTDQRSTHNTYVPSDVGHYHPSQGSNGGSDGRAYPQAHLQPDPEQRRDSRNSSYHLVFSNRPGAQTTQPGVNSSSPPQSNADFSTTPAEGTRQFSLATVPTRQITTRAEAEAEASNMRRVNEGFSVAKRGYRVDEESLAAAAREAQLQTGQAESSRELEMKERKKLQKKRERDADANEERRASQFKENI